MSNFQRLVLWAPLLIAIQSYAGTVVGQIHRPDGAPVANGELVFRLSRPAVLPGEAAVTPTPVSCYTTSSGEIVGVPDPRALPGVSANHVARALMPGKYFVRITYDGGAGESQPSPERQFSLSFPGALVIAAPAVRPRGATGFKIYIGMRAGSERLQGVVNGWKAFQLSELRTDGAPPPQANTSRCKIYFSDELSPPGTHYRVSLKDTSGRTMLGFPQSWCTFGGTGILHVSKTAVFGCGSHTPPPPIPVITNPNLNAYQGIAGPVGVGPYGLTAGSVGSPKGNWVTFPQVVTDGVTDNAAVINNAIAAATAAASGGGIVQLPCGPILVNSAINLTNRSSITFRGCAMSLPAGIDGTQTNFNTTTILCNTGTVCLDMTGSSHATLQDFSIGSLPTYSSPSPFILLQGRDVAAGGVAGQYCFAEFNRFQNVHVFTGHSTTANGNRGYLGIYNVGSELSTYDNVVVTADIAYWFDTENSTLNLSSPYQNLQTGCPFSMTDVEIRGGAIRQRGSTGNGAGIVARYTSHFRIGGNIDITGNSVATDPAITLLGKSSDWDIAAQFEDHGGNTASLYFAGNADRITFRAQTGNLTAGSIVGGANGVTVTNSTFSVSDNGAGSPPTLLPMLLSANFRNTSLDFATTNCLAMNLPNLALVNGVVRANGCNNANQLFAAGSSYLLLNDSGNTWIGPVTQGLNGVAVSTHQHARASTGVISAGHRTEVLLTWPQPFGDASYTVVCNVEDPGSVAASAGLVLERLHTKSATQIGVVINNFGSSGLSGAVDCVADHQ